MSEVHVIGVEGLGEVAPGEDLARTIADAREPDPGDIVVVSQKIVSKAEDRVLGLEEVKPSRRALKLAAATERDPALVELILAESRRIVRATPAALIVETHGGLICANAGIDSSNLAGEGTVALLPVDPDRSANELRERFADRAGGAVGVVICDSFGRPWRLGQTEVAIGCAGLEPLEDWRGRRDRAGRVLEATAIATADEVAAAADLARDKASGVPVVIVRGLERAVIDEPGPGARSLQRPPSQDLFR